MPTQVIPGVSTTVCDSAVLTLITAPAIPLLAPPGPLGALKIGLIAVLNGGATKNQVFANITLPAYTGYADSATLVWSVQLNESDGSLTVTSQNCVFQQTGDVGATIVGCYSWAAGPLVYAIAVFPTPVTLVNTGDGFVLTANWNLDSQLMPNVSYVLDS
jgi:hypothetical protein